MISRSLLPHRVAFSASVCAAGVAAMVISAGRKTAKRQTMRMAISRNSKYVTFFFPSRPWHGEPQGSELSCGLARNADRDRYIDCPKQNGAHGISRANLKRKGLKAVPDPHDICAQSSEMGSDWRARRQAASPHKNSGQDVIAASYADHVCRACRRLYLIDCQHLPAVVHGP